ncbi:MAG: type II secretion system F family protein [Thermoplasmata archaeon]|nr:type II secretion system F family protein [Thermoplasmata archaeon]MCI4359703.1 type II secretion system F family protein [Thermoplasmata archaeon]
MSDSKTAPAPPNFVSAYRSFCYRLLGARLDRGETDDLAAQRLKQAGIGISPGMFASMKYLTALFAAISSFAVGFLLFHVLLRPPMWYEYVGLVVAVSVGAVFGGFGFLISSRVSNRKSELERELPFTLSELSVLASTGMAPIELMHRMARRPHDPAITSEFKKVVYKTDIQGKDLITALAETAKESPSNTLRESFWDLANMIHQGGNLDEYLRNKSDDVLKLKRSAQKEFIEHLITFVDMYVSIVLVGVLLIAVGAFLLNTLGSTADGLDSNTLLILLTFGLVPLAVIMTTIMISVAYARAE